MQTLPLGLTSRSTEYLQLVSGTLCLISLSYYYIPTFFPGQLEGHSMWERLSAPLPSYRQVVKCLTQFSLMTGHYCSFAQGTPGPGGESCHCHHSSERGCLYMDHYVKGESFEALFSLLSRFLCHAILTRSTVPIGCWACCDRLS